MMIFKALYNVHRNSFPRSFCNSKENHPRKWLMIEKLTRKVKTEMKIFWRNEELIAPTDF
jgi:hypothetical protein